MIRVLLNNGQPSGIYEDFVTGFVTSEGKSWGRPVGVTVAKDGSLLISDDESNSIWRVSYHSTSSKGFVRYSVLSVNFMVVFLTCAFFGQFR